MNNVIKALQSLSDKQAAIKSFTVKEKHLSKPRIAKAIYLLQLKKPQSFQNTFWKSNNPDKIKEYKRSLITTS